MKHTFKKMYDGFSPSDFEAYPFWAWCLMEDEGEEWYDDICQTTYRGVADGLPLEVARLGLYQTTILTANGCQLLGIARWAATKLTLKEVFDDKGTIRLVHHRDEPCGVDTGVENDIARLEKLCGDSIDKIFPMTFSTQPAALSEKIEGQCFQFELVIFENKRPVDGDVFPSYD